MSNSSFKVEGFDELFKDMERLSEEIGTAKTDRIWKKALGYAMSPVLHSAKMNAPVDSGELKDHIYMKTHRPQRVDKSSSSYKGESFISRVTLSPKRNDSVQNFNIDKSGKLKSNYKHKPVGLAQEFGTATNSAHPFLRRALEGNIQNVIDRLGIHVWSELSWGKHSKKGNK